MENIQQTYRHRTLSQLAYEIGAKYGFEDKEDIENIVEEKRTIHRHTNKEVSRKSSKYSKDSHKNNGKTQIGSLECRQSPSEIIEVTTTNQLEEPVLVSPTTSVTTSK